MKGGSSSHVIVSCTSMGVLYNFQVDCIQISSFLGGGGEGGTELGWREGEFQGH